MPLTVLVFEKNGTIKELTIKKFNELELYKKAGLKSSNGFNNRTIWNIDGIKGKSYHLSLFGKIDGRANSENKYDLPPPVDETLYFNTMAIIKHVNSQITNETVVNLTKEEWGTVYEKLFGGFEDLAATQKEDDEELDELDNIPEHKKTKEGGYLKDGFVVDDVEEDVDTNDEDNETEEFGSCEEDETEGTSENMSYDSGSELSEESYIVET